MNVTRHGTFRIIKASVRHNSSYNVNISQIIENTKAEIMKHIDIRNNRLRNGIIGITVSCIGVGTFYYEDIKQYITTQSTDVATDTINNPKFKEQTIQFSSDALIEMCKNPEVQQNLTQLLVTALNTDEVKQSAVNLIQHVYEQDEIKQRTIKLVTDIVGSDEVKNTTQTSMEHILQNPEFRKELADTLYNVAIVSITPTFPKFWKKTPHNSNNSLEADIKNT
jgi:hypothetical protein